MSWQLDSDYAFCEQLDLAGWAWQFMRRAPAYRADYAEFIHVWRQLEAAYGAPPRRDFFKWKQDPRAWRSEAELTDCGSEACPGENGMILIECWMGEKWGFRKFPIDPAIDFPDQLDWRSFPVAIEVIDNPHIQEELPLRPELLALRFDLSLPLPAQLEAAKSRLIAARQACAAAGLLPPRNAREGASLWRLWLRLLDALEAGQELPTIAQSLALDHPQHSAAAARALRDGGYRRLLQLDRP
jgi:hypothetical protein